MWYYEINGQAQGPVTQTELLQLVQTGKVSPQTLVWQEGLANWIRLSETGLVSQLLERTTPPLYEPEVQDVEDPLLSKKLNTNKWLFLFFVIGCVLMLFSLAGYPIVISAVFSENQAAIITTSMIYQVLVWGANASYVLELILLYQFWKLVQDGHARTTPGKAIGFLFIPFFNFYWIFITYWGLAKELKRIISVQFSKLDAENIRKPKMFLSLLMSLSPFIYFVSIIVCISVLAVNVSTQSPEIFQQEPQKVFMSMMYPFLGMGGLLVLLRVAMISDFYLTVRSILKGKSLE